MGRSRRGQARGALIALSLLLLCDAPAFAGNGLFPMADGPRQRGRGGTVVAIAEDAMAINSNPAGLAFIDGRQLDVNLAIFFQDFQFKDPIQPEGVDGVKQFPQTVPLAASFGLVFRELGDLGALVPRTWGALEGSGELPGADASAEGEVSWNARQLPGDVKLLASGLASTLSDVRLLAYVERGGASDDAGTVVVERSQLPRVPAGARVIGVGVDFLWRHVARLSDTPALARLEVDGRHVVKALDGPGQRWTRAATSLILDQETLPGRVALRLQPRGQSVELREVRLRVGYKLNGRYHWLRVDLAGPTRAGPVVEVVELAREAAPRDVDAMDPRVIYAFPELRELPAGSRLQRIALRYRYAYTPSKSVANLLNVRALADGLEAAHTAHSMTEPVRPLPPADTALSGPLPPPRKHKRWTFGVGFFPQGGAGLEIDIRTDLYPEGITNRSDLLFVSLAPSVAFRPTERFAVGGSLLLNYGQMHFDGLISEPLSRLGGTAVSGVRFEQVFRALTPFDDLRGSIDMEPADTYGLAGKFGALWKVTDTLTVGASYATQTFNKPFETEAEVDFTRIFQASGLLVTLPALIFLPNGGTRGLSGRYKMEVDFQLPQHAAVGVAWRPRKWLRLSSDLRWIDWSSTMSEVEVKLRGGTNPDLNALVGSPDIDTVFRIGWQDQYVVALGAELFLDDRWVLRAGYNASNSPLSDSRFTSPQIPALTIQHLTGGFSYLTRRLDVHFGYSFGHREVSQEVFGESRISSDFDFIDVVFGPQHVVALGVTWRY